MSLYGRSVYGRCVTLEDMIYQMKYKIICVRLLLLVPLEEITEEVEIVRSQIYNKKHIDI
jgi:hypothetical protein